MKLYHSGIEIIEKPDVHAGRKNADFGPGFYLSNERDFAMRWIKCKEGEVSFVNVYDLDTDGLKIKHLSRDEEWFDYIYNNRNGRKDSLDSFDVIMGPIANDTLYDVFGIPTSGLLGKDDSLALLQLGGEYQQIVLKTEKAANQLRFEKVYGVHSETTKQYKELIKAETLEYQKEFQEYLERAFCA